MNRLPRIIVALALPAALLLGMMDARRSAADEAAVIDRSVITFLNTYCVRCHGPAKENASLRFDTMPTQLVDEATAQRWQDILDVLNLDEMPPADEKQPSDEELSLTLEMLTKNLREARERLDDAGGRQVLRRLNRREYQNTIRSLFGLDVSIESLPDDATVDGFDTIGLAHTFSSLHLERYLSTGGLVVERFAENKTPQPPEVRRHEPETEALENLQRQREKFASSPERKGKVKPNRKDGLQRSDVTELSAQLLKDYFAEPAAQTGALIPFRGALPLIRVQGLLGRTGSYKVRVRCGVVGPQPVDGVFLEVNRVARQSTVVDRVDCFEVRGTVAEPQIIEFEAIVDGLMGNFLSITRRTPRSDVLPRFTHLRSYFFSNPEIMKLADDERPSIWIDWIETEGPFPRFEAALDPNSVSLKATGKSDDDVRHVIEKFAIAACRQQAPAPAFLDRLLHIYRTTRENGADAGAATRDCLKVVLASPRFLFLYEPSAEGESRKLTARESATRLSYFLWSGPPDAELYRAAENGELSTLPGRAAQMDRLLAAKQSDEFVVHFLTQFLELDRLDGIDPTATAAPNYDLALRNDSKREVFETFRYLLRENRPAYELIAADYVVVNALLADFYGIPAVHGDDFRPVKLPAGSPRGGLLGQSAILALSGTGERTSPVERGAYILRKILHRPPPPAPANVPMLEEAGLGNRSIRETLAVHMNKPQCNSCHRRIDPLGFGLENFDPVGLWRESVLSADSRQRFAIEPAGLMPDGKRRFTTPHEMKELMVADKDAFLTGLTEAMMTYGIGRKIGYADQPEVERIVAAVAAKGYGLRTLLDEIIQSDAFQTK